MDSELEIVKLLKLKDRETFIAVYDRYAPALYSIVLKLTRDAKAANNILEKSFLRMWFEIATLDTSKRKLFTWMLGITIQETGVSLSSPHKSMLRSIGLEDLVSLS